MRKTLRAIGRPQDDRRHRDAEDARRHPLRRVPLRARGRRAPRADRRPGRAASTTVAMEAAAEAGEIARRHATAAALAPATCSARRAAAASCLRGAPDADAGLKPLPPVDGLPLVECVPRLDPRLTSASRQSRSRSTGRPRSRSSACPATDASYASEGAAAAAAAVAEVVEAVQDAAAEHEVCFLESDIDRDGARIVLVAGAPRVSENDVERMLRTVRAAVDVRDGAAALDRRQPGPRLRRRGRRAVPTDVHDPRRHCRAGRPLDGEGGPRQILVPAGAARSIGDALRDRIGRAARR